MPLSEFFRMARAKLESGHHKPCPTNLSSRSENDLVELVWENGQIMMRSQSSRVMRSPTRNNSPFNPSRVGDATASRFGKFGGADVAPVVPSGDMDLSQDDDTVPWFGYPMNDELGQDYVSQLLSNGMSTQNSFVSVDKRSSYDQTVSNLHNGGNTLKPSSSKDRLLCSWAPQQRQTPDALGSGVSEIVSNGNKSNQLDASMKMERQNIRPPNNSNFLNFSHFSRPVANASKESCPPERTKNLCQEIWVKNDKPQTLSNADNLTKGVADGERVVEPIVACSSVGSGNSHDRVSCEQTHNLKRRFRDIEELECRSDDVETESFDAKKRTSVRGSKRSQAAEVHNLSERRRRDRINEKMRALQELIPNSNKADKASMLDEAIEYLKTLQLQVQIMSMGGGLCMPAMMFPTVMQHMHVPHFPPMGYGMGMLNMTGGSSGCPIFPAPPMQVGQFSSPPVFGHPGQGQPMGLSTLRSGTNGGEPTTSPVTTLNLRNAEAGCPAIEKSNQLEMSLLQCK